MFILVKCLLMISIGWIQQTDEFTMTEFKKLHTEILPKNETWKSIPWHADLLSAQHQAVKEKKMIFIWSMDGHPLGCT